MPDTMQKKWLDLALEEYAQAGMYPFHMPGHKRHRSLFMNVDGNAGISHPFAYDITEIEGFDNLANPRGIIGELLQSLARLYAATGEAGTVGNHTKVRAWLSVNGSTGGMYAAIFAAAKRGDVILMDRGCHRCVYDAAMLRGLKLRYIPSKYTQGGWRAAVSPEDVEKALQDIEDLAAVVITTPTYEGECADTVRIASICHAAGTRLILDAAHGAHLGFSPYFPPSPVKSGADLVVMSLHKTLPVMGQAAAVFAGNQRLDVGKYLNIFNTSSPSYVIMASVSNAIRMLEESGKKLYKDYERRLVRFYEAASELNFLKVARPGTTDPTDRQQSRDPSKLVISGRPGSGPWMMELLRRHYRLELEMAGPSYCLAMTSIADTDAGFSRLIDALHYIDQKYCLDEYNDMGLETMETVIPTMAMELADTENKPVEAVPLERATGRIAGEFIGPYPPGVPLIVPGEIFDDRVIASVKQFTPGREEVLCLAHQ